MSRQNKKERQRLKRKRKQMQLRKERNASIFKKLAQVESPIRCYINSDWRDEGLACPLPGRHQLDNRLWLPGSNPAPRRRRAPACPPDTRDRRGGRETSGS